MSNHLPAVYIRDKTDVADLFMLTPLHRITEGLRKGYGYDMTVLRPLAWACRALADAYDHRVKLADMEDEVTTND